MYFFKLFFQFLSEDHTFLYDTSEMNRKNGAQTLRWFILTEEVYSHGTSQWPFVKSIWTFCIVFFFHFFIAVEAKIEKNAFLICLILAEHALNFCRWCGIIVHLMTYVFYFYFIWWLLWRLIEHCSSISNNRYGLDK